MPELVVHPTEWQSVGWPRRPARLPLLDLLGKDAA